jgi:hypothetical protein
MSSHRPELIQSASDLPGSLERAFRSGCAILFPWGRTVAEIAQAIRAVERYLSTLPIEMSFHGTDGLQADRQSLWVASTGLGQRLHVGLSEIAHLDGDTEGGARGIKMLKMLKMHPELRDGLSILKDEIDRALCMTIEGLGLQEELPWEFLAAVTVRYRAIRYAPIKREVAGVGMHPDGNVISALVTNQTGLTLLGGPGWIARPAPEAGIVAMPGSILTRWSDGALLPTMHAVEIHRGDPVKCTVVGFLNFADGSNIPKSLRFSGQKDLFHNDVKYFKSDDMRSDGGLADFYRDRRFVVKEGDKTRFRTFAELVP